MTLTMGTEELLSKECNQTSRFYSIIPTGPDSITTQNGALLNLDTGVK